MLTTRMFPLSTTIDKTQLKILSTVRWVAGALNSAYRCVEEIASICMIKLDNLMTDFISKLVHDKDVKRLAQLRKNWGSVGEVDHDNLTRQVLVGIHESTKLAFEVPRI